MATPEEVVEPLGAKIARQAARIAELEDRVTNRDARLVVQQGTYRLALAGVRSERDAARARAEKAEARCEALEATLNRTLDDLELDMGGNHTGPLSQTCDRIKAALRAVEG